MLVFRRASLRRKVCVTLASLALLTCSVSHAGGGATDDELTQLRAQFESEVDHRLLVPRVAQEQYISLIEDALRTTPVTDLTAQSFVLVDRSPQVQAAFVLVRDPSGTWEWIGGAAVSTGKTGTYEHFLTPLGVYPHTPDNPDYRAEGTFNENHIRGYGLRGKRVFDFGWQNAERGWGAGGISKMRLQMHATDPTFLEPRLGGVASEGCVRIPGTLNAFLDHHGILDADYAQAAASGEHLPILQADQEMVPWPGRYMVIVDSASSTRPNWSPAAGKQARSSVRRSSKQSPSW